MSDSTSRAEEEVVQPAKSATTTAESSSSDNNGQQRETEDEVSVDGGLADLEGENVQDGPDEEPRQINAVAEYTSPVSTGAGQPPPAGNAITVQIDARKIPSQRQTGNMTALDTRDLAQNYSDEQILLGLVAHPDDLHGTLFLRLAENFSNEELARRISELYDALELNKPKNNTYSKRFTGALKEEQIRRGWSDADYEREKERIKSRRKVQRPREWIYMPPILGSGKQTSPKEDQAHDHREADHQDLVVAPRSAAKEKTVQAQTAVGPQASSSIDEDSAEDNDFPSDEPISSGLVEDNKKIRKLTVKELAKRPSRKWTRNPLKFRSFTGSEWSVPTFTAAFTDEGQRSKVQSVSSKKKSTNDGGKASTTAEITPHQALAVADARDAASAMDTKEDKEVVVHGVEAGRDMEQGEEVSGKTS
ncbi:hypothetical protein HII31_01830 [Pseudocercospora fuligena]|uniref:Uncharacterized protein n=1 Tax=Pseudocercospora fuligena TaxID=685502 RepID=A0A8H6RU41_9PEZI|nr:hypothetical protein HII31_01830 [Pseudocercospora fuligena]